MNATETKEVCPTCNGFEEVESRDGRTPCECVVVPNRANRDKVLKILKDVQSRLNSQPSSAVTKVERVLIQKARSLVKSLKLI